MLSRLPSMWPCTASITQKVLSVFKVSVPFELFCKFDVVGFVRVGVEVGVRLFGKFLFNAVELCFEFLPLLLKLFSTSHKEIDLRVYNIRALIEGAPSSVVTIDCRVSSTRALD